MPTVSFNGQAFALDGRRIWLLGADLEYARIPHDEWTARIRDVVDAGFNVVEIACPWVLHEPRKNRFDFEGPADVRAFVEACGDAGLHVILRPGPFVGSGYDGGGLPAWLVEDPEVRLREANQPYMDRVGRWLRKLLGELTGLSAPKGGPVIAVQVEQDWFCDHDANAAAYVADLARLVREAGYGVPILTADNLWHETPDGIVETWQGDEDLLALLRQLRTVQPQAPRLVSRFFVADHATWGDPAPAPHDPKVVVRRLVETLAAGGQPIVSPFHGGTNPGFLGGRLPAPGAPGGRSCTTAAVSGAPVGEAGDRGPLWHALRPLATFVRHYGHVLAEVEPEAPAVVLDPSGAAGGTSVVSVRGGAGTVVFVLADKPKRDATLLLPDGESIEVALGDRLVGWYVQDVSPGGQVRIDHANVCPTHVVDKSLLAFTGPAKHRAVVSIDGSPREATVPSGRTPEVIDHKGARIVLLNEDLERTAHATDDRLYVGVDGIDENGEPIMPAAGGTVHVVPARGEVETIKVKKVVTSPRAPRLGTWERAPQTALADGSHARYARIKGPASLPACGATAGYGWYRLAWRSGAVRKRTVLLPHAGHRLHLLLNGEPAAVAGTGPGATRGAVDLKVARGEQSLVILADDDGRFADGEDLHRTVGVPHEPVVVKKLAGVKQATVDPIVIDPFAVRGFGYGRSTRQPSSGPQLSWRFTWQKKSPLLLDVAGCDVPGTFALNEVPLALYGGERGAGEDLIRIDPEALEHFKRGANELRFAAEPGYEDRLDEMAKAASVLEVVEPLAPTVEWSFCKWAPPRATEYAAADPAVAGADGVPCWWRTTFNRPSEAAGPLWVDTDGLTKGVVVVNGTVVGRYFTRTAGAGAKPGAAVGPQTRIRVPTSALAESGTNVLELFDEHGGTPAKVRLTMSAKGDLDG